ncbi:MAG TPA: Spy/CpxP family protein refolding chaperone [Syntrophobacteria bacterium]|nr:Spy/CpxP family protein refolding chaperone [Syntrophobacteria bacterium]
MGLVFFFLGLVSGLTLAAVSVAAVYWQFKRRRSRRFNVQGYLDLIPDLSEEQRRQVQEIRRVFLPKVARIRQDLYLKRAELADLLFTESPERPKIFEVADQILHHQSELEHEVIDHILEERQILTPAQERRFYTIIVDQFGSGGLGVHDVKARRT